MSGKKLTYNIPIECVICGQEFMAGRASNVYYCSTPCRAKSVNLRSKTEKPEKYKEAAERTKINARNHRASLRKFIDAVKTTAGCADCGYSAHPMAMDFDHLDSDTKIKGVSNFSTIRTALVEIEKCEVVCAICHRIRTYNRKQGWNGRHGN